MSINRLTGLTSGMDTESMIKKLMKAEQTRVDKVKQDKQYKVWEQEAFRGVITKLKSFQSNFLDILKPESSLRSQSFFSKFNSSATVNGSATSAVQVTGSASMTSFEHQISGITQLATKDTYVGADTKLVGVKTGDLDVGTIGASLKINLSIDNNVKTITVDTDKVADVSEISSRVNAAIQSAFGTGFSNVTSVDGNKLIFNQKGSVLKVFEATGDTTTLTKLGITSGASSQDYLKKDIKSLLGLTEADLSTMKINGYTLSSAGISEATTLQEFTKKISDSIDMNVNLSFNTIDGKFTLTSDYEGTVNNIDMSQGGTLGNILKIVGVDSTYTAGKNAELTIDGNTIVKSSNNFTIDGMSVSLKTTFTAAPDPINIKMTVDSSSITEKIKNFVKDYNEIISDLNSTVNEKRNRDYRPLTDEQKKDMSEEDIKAWEAKSKSGLLRGNSDLNQILDKMRLALGESVKDVGLTLKDIGISTSSSYIDRGKLILDETKLKSSIQTNFEKVVNMFTKKSSYEYQDASNVSTRYAESGFGDRLNDILNDYTRTFLGKSDKKGILIEKAGVIADSSVAKNVISKQISDYDTRISKLLETLANKENAYYAQFARMESALSQMQAQSTSLMQQLGR